MSRHTMRLRHVHKLDLSGDAKSLAEHARDAISGKHVAKRDRSSMRREHVAKHSKRPAWLAPKLKNVWHGFDPNAVQPGSACGLTGVIVADQPHVNCPACIPILKRWNRKYHLTHLPGRV